MKPRLTFGIMTDCQYADADPTGALVPGTNNHVYDNQFRLSPGKLQQAVEVFNQQELDFVIHLGDFIDRNLDEADSLLTITSGLNVPLWHVLGNHDFMGSEGNQSRVLAKYGMENGYYSKRLPGFRLVILDTNELGVIKYKEDSEQWKTGRQAVDRLKAEGAIQAYDWNGGIGAEQLTWLDSELNDADNAGERAILFAHHPVYPPGSLNALDDSAILDVIDKHLSVIAFINGHNHIGDFGERHSVPYVTVPGMLQGDTNAYGIVQITGNTLDIRGYGRLSDINLPLHS